MAATFVRPRLIVGFRFPARSLSKSTGNENDSDGLPACQRLRRRLVPCGEASWPQPLPSSQASAGKTIGGLAAQCSASGLSSSCPCLKKTLCHAQHFLENPYLCTRLRSHKMELSVTMEAESPISSASIFIAFGAAAFGNSPVSIIYKESIISCFFSSLTFRYREMALLPSAWPLIDAMSASLKPAS